MDFGRIQLSAAQHAFQREARAFFVEHVTAEVIEHEARTGDGFHEALHLAMGQRGWIQPRWPVSEGGAGLDAVQARILQIERMRCPIPWVTLDLTNLVSDVVKRHATAELATEVLPGVARGDVRFCLGYTEPHGGSDIAAALTRAVRDGSDWVVNGQKVFTTGAHNSQYAFLLTRTDFDAPKHKGLTMFLAPMDAPGVQIHGFRTFSGERTNNVYYTDVRLPDRYRLGPVNDGWTVLRGPLDAEHGADSSSEVSISAIFLAQLQRALDAAIQWATTPQRPDGTRPADDPDVRRRLGVVAILLEAALSTPSVFGKVKAAQAVTNGAAALMDVVGPAALLSRGSEGAIGGGELEFCHRYAQATATYGGTVEVFRALIAEQFLGLPKAAYPGRRLLVTN